MQYSIGVEYALHCLVYLTGLPSGSSIGIKELAKFQGVSQTYLSKIFTKLSKDGIVRSIPGAKGGYQLAREPENITFWDVVQSIEGSTTMFQCAEIRQSCILLNDTETPDWMTCESCTIKTVMLQGENLMRDYLSQKNLAWLSNSIKEKIPLEYQKQTEDWFKKVLTKKMKTT
ncbi:RrF2 family transcriptional regulator [Paenibacillus gansuensis]|uniref:RrF2 family transcriptional regulator n=1 Tax=Paenibacillus gansuensis TaxID=306542 RepID=A0ABW5PJ23_9BACL